MATSQDFVIDVRVTGLEQVRELAKLLKTIDRQTKLSRTAQEQARTLHRVAQAHASVAAQARHAREGIRQAAHAARELRPATDQLRVSLSRVAGAFGATGRSAQTAGEFLQRYRWRVAAVAAALGGFAGYAIRTASDATELWNRFNVTLRENAARVRAWAVEFGKRTRLGLEDVAESASIIAPVVDALGLSADKAAELTAKLTQATFDLASTMNIDLQRAQQVILSGLAGESEALRRYGILTDVATLKTWALQRGLIAAGEELTEQQKRLLAALKILEDMQARGFWGDFERTNREFANTMRVLQSQARHFFATMGEGLMRLVLPFANLLADLLVTINRSPVLAQITGRVVALAAALGGATLAFGGLTIGLAAFKRAMAEVSAMPVVRHVRTLAVRVMGLGAAFEALVMRGLRAASVASAR